MGGELSPLLSPGEATPGVTGPVLSSSEPRQEHTGPVKLHKDAEGTRASLTRGEAGRDGTVHPENRMLRGT